MVRHALEKAIRDALGPEGAGVSFAVDHPPVSAGADYATNAALAAGKVSGKAPREVAAQLVERLSSADLPFVEQVFSAGPGFVNIALTRGYFTEELKRARAQGKRWGGNTMRAGSRIMVEHTQPNPFKPFHIGHLMSNTIGESIARLMSFSGASVMPVNYQGDVGLHVAKALWAIEKKGLDAGDVKQLGDAYVYGNAQYEESEEAKKEIQDINKRVYAQDPALMPVYEKGRKASLSHFEELYRTLGSSFERYFFEGEVWQKGAGLIKEGVQSGVFEESDGAVVYRGEKAGFHTRVFLTREGLPTYEGKELGLALCKIEYKPFDLSITTTAVEQAEYFKVVFAALAELRPELKGKFMHISHGMMQLQGGKMSSRKGNVITGESLLTDMKEEAVQKMKGRELEDADNIASAVGVAAIKYAVLRQSLGRNIIFEPERSLSLEGDSGPYLQYAHTRACSILRKAKEEGLIPDAGMPSENAYAVEKLLPQFPEQVERAAHEFEPHHVAQYLTDLAGEFNSWYAAERVIGSGDAPYKLAVVDAVRQTLENGLWLLGCRAPERM